MLVVGAGAVGLACAYALALRGRSVVMLEKADAIGQGVSSRNSEVIHAGLYYPDRLAEGAALRRGPAAALSVPARRMASPIARCGKLVVATEPDQIAPVEAICAQAKENDVEGVAADPAAEARRWSRSCRVAMALASPESGIFDSHGYMLALEGEIEDRGGAVVVATPFEGAATLPGGGFRVRAGGAEPTSLACRALVIAAGLGAQDAAARDRGLSGRPHPASSTTARASTSPARPRAVRAADLSAADPRRARRPLSHATWAARRVFGPDLAYVEHEDYIVDPVARRGSMPTSAASGPGCRMAH